MEILNLKKDPGQLELLAAWHQKEWAHLNAGKTIEHRIKKMQLYLNDDFIPSTYIAKSNTLLGSAAVVSNDLDIRPELSPWLASVFVRPDNRNSGIGKQLILHVMSQAKKHGIDTLYLFTENKGNYYKKLGWRTIEKTALNGAPISIMKTTFS